MIKSLMSMGLLETPIAFVLALVIGVLFGLCLERAGFGSSRRLTGIFYFKDMTVFKVMFTAVVTAMLGLQLLIVCGLFSEEAILLTPTMYGAHTVAGLLFGTGFAMRGWCPGTAAVGVVSGKMDALLFLLGAIIGSIIFNESHETLSPLLEWGYVGVVHTYESLTIPQGVFVIGFTAIAIGSLWGCERLWPWRVSTS